MNIKKIVTIFLLILMFFGCMLKSPSYARTKFIPEGTYIGEIQFSLNSKVPTSDLVVLSANNHITVAIFSKEPTESGSKSAVAFDLINGSRKVNRLFKFKDNEILIQGKEGDLAYARLVVDNDMTQSDFKGFVNAQLLSNGRKVCDDDSNKSISILNIGSTGYSIIGFIPDIFEDIEDIDEPADITGEFLEKAINYQTFFGKIKNDGTFEEIFGGTLTGNLQGKINSISQDSNKIILNAELSDKNMDVVFSKELCMILKR